MDCSGTSGGVLTFYLWSVSVVALGLAYFLVWKWRKP